MEDPLSRLLFSEGQIARSFHEANRKEVSTSMDSFANHRIGIYAAGNVLKLQHTQLMERSVMVYTSREWSTFSELI